MAVRLINLLLLTGARREEVAGMRWSELHLDAGMWFLPGARTKNKRDHRIPLSRQAINLLDRLGIAAIKAGFGYEDSDLIFSSTGHSAPSGFSKAKKALDAKMKAILGARFKDCAFTIFAAQAQQAWKIWHRYSTWAGPIIREL